MSKISIVCSASALALAIFHCTAATAQTVPASDAPASAQQSASDPATQGDIVVTASRRSASGVGKPVGAGEYALGKSDYADVMAGTSALALVKNLPGVTFTSTDAYGLDLSDGFLLVRGFRQNEIAITFEGIPLNDGSYGSVTGTAPLNIGVSSNINGVQISPGAAHVGTLSNSANGGEIRYTLADPARTPSIEGLLGYGSYDTVVSGLSVQTGQVGGGGPRMLLGVERIAKNKYTGNGSQEAIRGNLKLVQEVPWGDFTAFFSVARTKLWGYNNTSFDMLDKLGYDKTDIFYPDYRHAIYVSDPRNADRSCGAYSCGDLATLIPYDTGQRTVDAIGNLAHHFRLTNHLSGNVMGYAAISSSDIEIADVSTPSQTGVPFSAQVWQTRPRRFGGTVDLTWEAGAHALSTGLWIERTTATSQFASYNEPVPGTGEPLRSFGPYKVYGPAFQIANMSRWRINSFQAYVEDVFKPTDELTIRAGVKAVDFVTSGGGIGADHAPRGKLHAANAFLPQASLEWKPDGRSLLYLDLAETEVGYRVSSRGNIGPVSSAYAADSQEAFDAALLNPERDWNFTVGGYHAFGAISLNIDGYYGIVLNRLINGTSGPQYAPVRSVGVVSRSTLVGADAIVTARVAPGLTLSQSVSLSKLRYNDDLVLPDTRVPLRGHFQPGYPGASLVTQARATHGRAEGGWSARSISTSRSPIRTTCTSRLIGK